MVLLLPRRLSFYTFLPPHMAAGDISATPPPRAWRLPPAAAPLVLNTRHTNAYALSYRRVLPVTA